MCSAIIEVELKQLLQAEDGLTDAIAKLRKAFKHVDRGDEYSDLFLDAINMLENVRDDYLGAWLEEYQLLAIEDSRKLEVWKLWATQ